MTRSLQPESMNGPDAAALAPLSGATEGTSSEEELRIGGIALRNGLALVSERHWAAAIREADGTISVASGKKVRIPGSGDGLWGPRARRSGATEGVESPRIRTTDGANALGKTAKASLDVTVPVGASPGRTVVARTVGIPLVRGLGRFGESLLVLGLVKAKLPNAELPLEGGRVAAALAGSMAATKAVRAVTAKSAVAEEVGTALAAFVPAVLALKNSSIAGYHGAEHKVIGGREAALRAHAGSAASDAALVTGDAGAAAKEHDRCGSNLVGPYLLATVATNLLARGRLGRKSPLGSAAAGAASLGLALEALRWANKNADSVLARLLLAPGRAIQKRLTTSEPTPEQLEVGERALAELLRLEHATG